MADLRENLDPDPEQPTPPAALFEAIGQSPAFLDFQERLRRVAPVERPVLLVGERGTGKEMAAQRLHYLSKRWGQPLVTLNCAALTPSLIESELFGHEAGAFTGAVRRRIGRFEAADDGSLFLDEISLIPIETQEKILRVVEYGNFERVGGTRSVQVDVRIIGATNVDLAAESERGRFKMDLLDRLSFEVLFMPPLRERKEDIPLLANHFASRMAYELGREEIPQFADEAMGRLLGHPWPGNVRELKNVVERAVYRAEGDLVDSLRFDPFESPYAPLAQEQQSRPMDAGKLPPQPPRLADGLASLEELSLRGALRSVELHFLRRALRRSRYNQRRAAESMGLSYDQFRHLYRKHAGTLKGDREVE